MHEGRKNGLRAEYETSMSRERSYANVLPRIHQINKLRTAHFISVVHVLIYFESLGAKIRSICELFCGDERKNGGEH